MDATLSIPRHQGCQPSHNASADGQGLCRDVLLLFDAIEQGDAGRAARLLDRVDLTQIYKVDGQQKTHLHSALIEDRSIIAMLLLAKGAPVNVQLPGFGTPLHMVTRIMLDEYRNKEDSVFEPSFFVPTKLELFSLLLHHGASVEALDDKGQTIFHTLCNPRYAPYGLHLYARVIASMFATCADADTVALNPSKKQVAITRIREALSRLDGNGCTPVSMLCMDSLCLHEQCAAKSLYSFDENNALSTHQNKPITLEMICADDSDGDGE